VRGIGHYTRSNVPGSAPGFAYRGLEIFGLSPSIHEKIAEYATTYLPKGSRILDLGCGSGALCARLSDIGFYPMGCDALPDTFKLHGEVPFFVADLNSDFSQDATKQLDAICATEVIEHLENPRHFIRQCKALLKNGGKIFITTPNVDSPMAKAYLTRTGRFWMFSEGYYEGVGHITPIPKWVLSKALTEAGFKILSVDSIGDWGRLIDWWKMRMLAWMFRQIEIEPQERGQILLVAAELQS